MSRPKTQDMTPEELEAHNDLCFVLASEQGRRLLWGLLGVCKTYGSIMETSSKIYYNAGRQDVGHMLLARITKANPEAYFQMMREAQARGAKE